MYFRIIKRDRLIIVNSAFREIARMQQRTAHKAVPNYEGKRCLLLLGKRQELRRKLARCVAVECHKVSNPETAQTPAGRRRSEGRASF
jgi:hypothetical protein